MLQSTKLFLAFVSLGMGILLLAGCQKDDAPPPIENEEEVISHITLIFADIQNPNNRIEVRAIDPDGPGAESLTVQDTLFLMSETSYRLSFAIENALSEPAINIGQEILEEAADHQLFFGFTPDAFSNPPGNGNMDVGTDSLLYVDADQNGLPLGLETEWITSSLQLVDGFFQVRLQHLPGIKTINSQPTDGDTDFDITFRLYID